MMTILVKRFLAPVTGTDLWWEVPSLPQLHFLPLMIRIIAIVESGKCLCAVMFIGGNVYLLKCIPIYQCRIWQMFICSNIQCLSMIFFPSVDDPHHFKCRIWQMFIWGKFYLMKCFPSTGDPHHCKCEYQRRIWQI